MSKLKVGDNVLVRSGKWRTKTGVIAKMIPATDKAIVEGVNIIKKHQKKTAQHPQGGILERPAPIALSKLMIIDPSTKKPSRIRVVKIGDKPTRQFIKSGKTVEDAVRPVKK